MSKAILPGVYIEEVPSLPRTIVPVETAIPVFIGYTQKAEQNEAKDLLFQPTRITSLLEYERYFGSPFAETSIQVSLDTTQPGNIRAKASVLKPSIYLMHYSLQLYFSNGGGTCYIISVGVYSTRGSISFKNLSRGLKAAAKIGDATLTVFPDSTGLTSHAEYYSLHKKALMQAATLRGRFVVMDVWTSPADKTFNAIDALRNFDFGGSNVLQFGAAYYPRLLTTIDYSYEASGSKVKIVCDTNPKLSGTLKALKAKSSASYAAAQKAMADIEMLLPSSAAVVGIYALIDLTRGVWKAPANHPISGVIAPAIMLNDQQHENLNVDVVAGKSINAIRLFTGKGTLIWGARTLAGNDNEWRYVPVRRFFIMIEKSISSAIQPFVFEPNDANTWIKIKAMIENYLNQQWRIGALVGTKPEHAFYVKVGLNETMTAADLLQGRLIIEIGMALIRPAEFTLLRIQLKMQAS